VCVLCTFSDNVFSLLFQLFGDSSFLVGARKHLPPFVPLVIDSRVNCPESLRVRSGHLSAEETLVFQPKDG